MKRNLCPSCGKPQVLMKNRDGYYYEVCLVCGEVHSFWTCPKCKQYSEYTIKPKVISSGDGWRIIEEVKFCLNCKKTEGKDED